MPRQSVSDIAGVSTSKFPSICLLNWHEQIFFENAFCFVLLNDLNDDVFGLKDLRVGLTSQRLRQKKSVFPCRPRFPTLEPWNRIWRQSWFPTIQASLATFMHRYCLVLRNGPVTERFVWLNVRMIWKHVLYSLFVLLNGPASSCLSVTRGSPW